MLSIVGTEVHWVSGRDGMLAPTQGPKGSWVGHEGGAGAGSASGEGAGGGGGGGGGAREVHLKPREHRTTRHPK